MLRLFLLLIIVIGISLLPIQIFALGTSYFEFNPDYFKTKSINILAEGGLVSQVFLPVNEFFGGFDIWFDNSGNSGPATFELYDQSNNLIMSKTITIPHINPVAGGQRTHIDWDSQISVVGSQKYKINIKSLLPSLQIYYSDRIGFLGHNAPQQPAYLNGAAEINGEEKEFSFKFSLYERAETSLPVISNTNVAILSADQAKINFNVNEPVDYKIDYGLNQNYSQSVSFTGSYNVCISSLTVCSITFNISPNSFYYYQLTVKDIWGNQRQVTGNFTSLADGSNKSTSFPTLTPVATVLPSQSQTPIPLNSPKITTSSDLVPPVISDTRIAYLGDKSVHIAWTTNKAADSNLLISFTTNRITITAQSDTTLELEHLLKIEGLLDPKTKYFATITSRDMINNTASASLDFITLALGQVSPVPTPVTNQPSIPIQPNQNNQSNQNNQNNLNNQSANSIFNSVTINNSKEDPESIVVNWSSSANPSTGYRIDVFDEDNSLIKTITAKNTERSVKITGISRTSKSIIVYANNNGIFEKISLPVKTIPIKSTFTQRLLAMWYILITPIIILIGIVVWKFIIRKKTISSMPPI